MSKWMYSSSLVRFRIVKYTAVPNQTHPENIHSRNLMYIIILSICIHFEHSVNKRDLAERAQMEFFKALLVLQVGQSLSQFVKCAY